MKSGIEFGRSGQIVEWIYEGRQMVGFVDSPLWSVDRAGRRHDFHVERSDGESFEGKLGTSAAKITMRSAVDASQVSLEIEIVGEEMSDWGWALPLFLDHEKRVAFRGDYGLDWDGRHTYEFHCGNNGVFLTERDVTTWRWFAFDQLGPDAFRLWKAESQATSPLLMQEGRLAAPLVQVYDSAGGISMECPTLRDGGPVRLLVDASGSGAIFLRHLPSPGRHPAPVIRHEIVLTAHRDEMAVRASRTAIAARWESTEKPADVLREEKWLTDTPSCGTVWVTGGWPFVRGDLADVSRIAVALDGMRAPLQARPLARWPDGSIKWALLTFPADPEHASEASPPGVTFRTGLCLPVQVTQTDEPGPRASETVEVRETEEMVSVHTGVLRVGLRRGPHWLAEIVWNNQNVLAERPGNRFCVVDFLLDPEQVPPFEPAVGGTVDQGTLDVQDVCVEESGPLRAVVRLEGLTNNREPARIILRLTFHAGSADIHISHTIEFLFRDPRNTFLLRLGLEIPISISSQTSKLVLQQTHDRSSHLRREGDCWKCERSGEAEQGWMEAECDTHRWLVAIRHFAAQYPKGLGVEDGCLRVDLWPAEAGPMDVRRYSETMHRAQGEAPGETPGWVWERYFDEEPFLGISRSHEILLRIAPSTGGSDSAAKAADFSSPPLLYAGWDIYESIGVATPTAPEKQWPRAWAAWTNFTKFFLFHRKMHRWFGFWNFGDLRHYFRDGHGWILPPGKVAEFRERTARGERIPPIPASERTLDYQSDNDWAYDNGRWGWSNTEGLPNLFLQHEYLRHGNRVVYFAAEALARHSRDVITRHEGRWLGTGTRHGVQHWSDGNHEERQTTVTEYRIHYYLSGEGRSRDVIEKLYRKVYSCTPVNVHASHSGRLSGLLFHWELTGSVDEAETLRRYIATFVSPDGLFVEPDVTFPGPEIVAPSRKLNDGSMFFHTFGGMHALVEYHQLTGDPALAAALVKMAGSVVSDPAMQNAYMKGTYDHTQVFWPPIAFAAIHAPDPRPYREFLFQYLLSSGWRRMFQPVSFDPSHWTGESGFVAGWGQVPFSFFWQNWATFIAKALDQPEVWSPSLTRAFETFEVKGALADR